MKVTRDKTQSVDLGNGLRLAYDSLNGCWLHYTDSNGDTESEKLDLANNWANEILIKHFTPITITLETEDEACTLWHCLNTNGDYLDGKVDGMQRPKEWQYGQMWHELLTVYDIKDE